MRFFFWFGPLSILHLCFADDLFLFAKGNMDNVQITLDKF